MSHDQAREVQHSPEERLSAMLAAVKRLEEQAAKLREAAIRARLRYEAARMRHDVAKRKQAP